LQKNNIYFLLFNTIHDVLKVDKILKKEKVHYELVPVPRNLSSDCGMCVKLEDDLETIKQLITNIKTEKCFFFDGTAYVDLG
jgi:hypothetical protein